MSGDTKAIIGTIVGTNLVLGVLLSAQIGVVNTRVDDAISVNSRIDDLRRRSRISEPTCAASTPACAPSRSPSGRSASASQR